MDTLLHLVLDIGGTNTRLALTQNGTVQTGTIQAYKNADFTCVEDVIRRYLQAQKNPPIHTICADAAGPVQGTVVYLTNRDWTVSTQGLQAASGADQAYLINDLQAMGYATTALPKHSCAPIVHAPASAGQGTKLVVNIGTGFNAVPVFKTPSGAFVPPSECGHVDLPLSAPQLLGINAFPGPAVEEILSGRGLEGLYAAFSPANAVPLTSVQILASADTDPIVPQTLQAFTRIFAKICRDLALIHLPMGGIYLTGGLGKALAPHFKAHGFAAAFQGGGPFKDMIETIPVYVIEEEYAALYGAASYIDTLLKAAS